VCCKVVEVEELNKPRHAPCVHCDPQRGCGIWGQPQRPPVCGEFFCGYMCSTTLGEHWKPFKCRMVVVFQENANRILVHVDRARSYAWRQRPYIDDLRAWARNGAPRQQQVIVLEGDEMIAILPDREKPLGKMKKTNQTIVFATTPTPSGPRYDILAFDDDDPQLAALRRQAGQTI
jgi:hypothetical protein